MTRKHKPKITIYIDEDLRDKFRLLCVAHGVSMNQQVIKMIDEFIDRNEGAIKINKKKLST